MKKQKESFTFISISLHICVLNIYLHVHAIKKYILSQTINEYVMGIAIWRDSVSQYQICSCDID